MDEDGRAAYILENTLRNTSSEPTNLPLSLFKEITENFSQEVGSGGFGVVYKGVLRNGMVVAVKKLSDSNIKDESFQEEVSCLMRTKHKNVVRFLGYCADTQGIMMPYKEKYVLADRRVRLLCFEYVSNGSLDSHLSDEFDGLEWHERYRVIKGICQGLLYLHEEENIFHLDLKPANVLLDHNRVPKITDFGLSRLFDSEQSQVNTMNCRGSMGYMAPEYLLKGIISFKADIYSLGMIILEVITGKREQPCIEHVRKNWRKRLQKRSVLQSLEVYCQQVKRCTEIALDCLETDRDKRPNIGDIILQLNETETMIHEVSPRCNELGISIDQFGDEESIIDFNSSITFRPATLPAGGGAVASIVSRSTFDQMLLHRNDDVCPAKGFYTYDAFVAAASSFPGFGSTGDADTRKREVAAFLAHTSHATTGGWAASPDGPYSWGYCFKEAHCPTSDCCVQSAQWPCAPGRKYYGRGPIQLSYNYNYGPAGQAIGVDLLKNPDLVATDPTVSFKTAIWFWMAAHPPKPSCHAVITGQWSPSGGDDEAAGGLRWHHVIANIIGGGLDSRVTGQIGFYKRYCDIIGVSYGENLDCYNNERPFA